MQHILSLIRDAASGGVVVARAALRYGRVTIQVIVKVFAR